MAKRLLERDLSNSGLAHGDLLEYEEVRESLERYGERVFGEDFPAWVRQSAVNPHYYSFCSVLESCIWPLGHTEEGGRCSYDRTREDQP